ncbi:MAG TPA: protein translocase subunit SecD, partial [Sphingomicrobium sp.]|nr:protein translocase subunit SecD [Sphingomicrobium sp.]
MLEFPRWKVWIVSLVVALGVLFSIPSLIAGTTLASRWPSWLPHEKISLGLDLAGGSHLLLEADANDALKQRLQAKEDEVSTELRRDPRIEIGDISTAGGRLSFLVRDPTQVDAAVERLRKLSQPLALTGNRDWDVQVVDQTRVVLIPTPGGTVKALKDAMSVARDVVRRRIDPGGTKEITVITEGADRILVQVPGVENPEQLKKLIGQTARLEFKLVDMEANPADVQQGRAPPGSQVLPMADGSGAIAVKRRVMVSGDQLTKASQGFDQDGRPDINIVFDTAGARRFGRVTQENVGKPFAIILDDKVLSAPNINEPILGGQAQITGSFTVQSANDLAVALASGKLPVKLNVIEERTVGPDLGKDSIHKGVIASVIGTVGVMIFMLITYGRFGVYANIALIVNAFLILAVMAIFNATLTLPGIAGFILTIGAAVDANVLINERIREEIRRGRRLIDA